MNDIHTTELEYIQENDFEFYLKTDVTQHKIIILF